MNKQKKTQFQAAWKQHISLTFIFNKILCIWKEEVEEKGREGQGTKTGEKEKEDRGEITFIAGSLPKWPQPPCWIKSKPGAQSSSWGSHVDEQGLRYLGLLLFPGTIVGSRLRSGAGRPCPCHSREHPDWVMCSQLRHGLSLLTVGTW